MIDREHDLSITRQAEVLNDQPRQRLLSAAPGIGRRSGCHATSRSAALGVSLRRFAYVARPAGFAGVQDRPPARQDANAADGDSRLINRRSFAKSQTTSGALFRSQHFHFGSSASVRSHSEMLASDPDHEQSRSFQARLKICCAAFDARFPLSLRLTWLVFEAAHRLDLSWSVAAHLRLQLSKVETEPGSNSLTNSEAIGIAGCSSL